MELLRVSHQLPVVVPEKKMFFFLKPKDFVKTIFEQEFALIIQSSI